MQYLLAFLILISPSLFSQDVEVIASKENYANFESHNSVTSFDESRLAGSLHLDEVIDKVPNLTSAGGVSRSRFFQIRGIGERSSYEGMPNASIGVLIDDIDYTGFGGVLSLFGLDSLEIYRGPQSSTAGPSALAGMIHAKTLKPTKEKSLNLLLERSSFNTTNGSLATGFSSSQHSMSLVAQSNNSDGIIRNSFLSREDTSNIEERLLRIKYFYKQDNLRVSSALHSFHLDNGYDVFNLNNSRATRSDHPGRDRQFTNGASITFEKFKGDFIFKTIISGHQTKTLYSYDEDWGNNPEWQQFPGWNTDYNYRIEFQKKIDTFSLEQRVDYQTDFFKLSSGIYYRSYKENFSEVGFNGTSQRKNIFGTFKRHNLALYSQLERELNQHFTLFSGARLESFKSRFSDTLTNQFRPQAELCGFDIGVKTENKKLGNLYIKAARGYKAGGVNTAANVPASRKEFSDESLYSFELGHTSPPSSLYSGQTTIFLMLRRDIQVKTSFQDNPSDPSSFTFYTDNATTGRSYGLEHESLITPSDLLHFSFQASLLNTKYGSYQYGSRNLDERDFAYAPEYSLSISPILNISESAQLMATFFSQDNFYFGNSHDEKATSFQSIDLRAKFKWDKFRFSLGVFNLLDDRRETRGFFFGNRPPSFTSERFVQIASPRRLMAQIEFNL